MLNKKKTFFNDSLSFYIIRCVKLKGETAYFNMKSTLKLKSSWKYSQVRQSILEVRQSTSKYSQVLQSTSKYLEDFGVLCVLCVLESTLTYFDSKYLKVSK